MQHSWHRANGLYLSLNAFSNLSLSAFSARLSSQEDIVRYSTCRHPNSLNVTHMKNLLNIYWCRVFAIACAYP